MLDAMVFTVSFAFFKTLKVTRAEIEDRAVGNCWDSYGHLKDTQIFFVISLSAENQLILVRNLFLGFFVKSEIASLGSVRVVFFCLNIRAFTRSKYGIHWLVLIGLCQGSY